VVVFISVPFSIFELIEVPFSDFSIYVAFQVAM
jgi:hypothetical protein